MHIVLKSLHALLHKDMAHSLTSLFLQTTRASAVGTRVCTSPISMPNRAMGEPGGVGKSRMLFAGINKANGNVRPITEARSNAIVTIPLMS